MEISWNKIPNWSI